MRRISSQTTFWYKRVFPVFWFGIPAIEELIARNDSQRAA
jgi:hypothetical protein